MIDIEDKTEYAFKYTDCDGKVYNTTIQQPGPTWMEALDDFVGFLESVFGYDIKNQVRLEEPKWLSTMYDNHHDYLDPWTGEYFTKDED